MPVNKQINFTINFTVDFEAHARKIEQIVKLIQDLKENKYFFFINNNQLYDLVYFACARPKNGRKVDRKVDFLVYEP